MAKRIKKSISTEQNGTKTTWHVEKKPAMMKTPSWNVKREVLMAPVHCQLDILKSLGSWGSAYVFGGLSWLCSLMWENTFIVSRAIPERDPELTKWKALHAIIALFLDGRSELTSCCLPNNDVPVTPWTVSQSNLFLLSVACVSILYHGNRKIN